MLVLQEKRLHHKSVQNSFFKLLSQPCNHLAEARLNQGPVDKQDLLENFGQMVTRPRKRETEPLLGETVGPGRGLFSNILSRLEGGRLKRAQGVKALFTHILRWEDLCNSQSLSFSPGKTTKRCHHLSHLPDWSHIQQGEATKLGCHRIEQANAQWGCRAGVEFFFLLKHAEVGSGRW